MDIIKIENPLDAACRNAATVVAAEEAALLEAQTNLQEAEREKSKTDERRNRVQKFMDSATPAYMSLPIIWLDWMAAERTATSVAAREMIASLTSVSFGQYYDDAISNTISNKREGIITSFIQSEDVLGLYKPILKLLYLDTDPLSVSLRAIDLDHYLRSEVPRHLYQRPPIDDTSLITGLNEARANSAWKEKANIEATILRATTIPNPLEELALRAVRPVLEQRQIFLEKFLAAHAPRQAV